MEKGLPKNIYEKLAHYRYQWRKFTHFSEKAARSLGLTPQQHQLMLAIKGYPGRDYATPTELAERLQITHHACLGLIGRSEETGLVQRFSNKHDKRSIYIRLTPKGGELLEKLSEVHLEQLIIIGLWHSDLEDF